MIEDKESTVKLTPEEYKELHDGLWKVFRSAVSQSPYSSGGDHAVAVAQLAQAILEVKGHKPPEVP